MAQRPPILLIHGAWVNGHSWHRVKARYEARGYEVHAPSWPHDDRPPAELRASPSEELAKVGVGEILAHYTTIAAGLSRPPILIGHSYGGLFTQLLLTKGVGVAGVAVHPAPPTGVNPSWSAIKAAWPVFGTWGHWKKVVPMSLADWVWCFTHQLPEAEQKATYDEYVVPTPGRIYFQSVSDKALVRPDYEKKDRGPLLIVSGDADRTVTADMNAANHALYAKSGAVTELLPMKGRSHFTLGEPGWEEVADKAIAWLEDRLGIEQA